MPPLGHRRFDDVQHIWRWRCRTYLTMTMSNISSVVYFEKLCTLIFWLISHSHLNFLLFTKNHNFLSGFFVLSAVLLMIICGGLGFLMFVERLCFLFLICRKIFYSFHFVVIIRDAVQRFFNKYLFVVYVLITKKATGLKQYDSLIRSVAMASYVIIVSSVTFICILFSIREFLLYEIQFLKNKNLEVGGFLVYEIYRQER